jgi:hypothetical protein
VVAQWKKELGLDQAYVLREIVNRAINQSDFWNALLTVAATRGNGQIVSNERLGRWLTKNEGRIVNGLALTRAGRIDGYPLWRLVWWG